MNYIHGQHGITARSRSVSLSIFVILILVTLASCNTTGTETETPTAPAGLKDLAVIKGSIIENSIELTWSQPTDFGTTDGKTAAIFGSYTVKVYEGADDSGSEVEGLTLEPASLDESTVSVKVFGLSSGTRYAFKLVLSNGNDLPLSSDSNVVSETTMRGPTAPAGLKDLAVKEGSITVESVELTWSQPTDFGTTDGTTAAIFGSYTVKVYEGADDSGSEVEGLTLEPASLDESTVSVKVFGLSSGTRYAFKLVLSNGNDLPLSSDSNVVSEIPGEPLGRIWTKVSVKGNWFSSGRKEHTAVVFNNKIWVIGGKDDSQSYYNDVWSSSDGKSWTEVVTSDVDAARFSARISHAAVVFDSKLWVIGGYNDTPTRLNGTRLNDVWSSPDGKVWTEVTKDVTTTRFSERTGHAAAVFDSKLWVIGGANDFYRNDVWSSSDGKSWTEVVKDGNTPTINFTKRTDHAVAVFDGKLWVIGGYADNAVFDGKGGWVSGGGPYNNDVWSSSDGKSWTEETKGVTSTRFSGRDGHTVSVLDGKLWAIGGFNGDDGNKYYNDVWSSSDGKVWTEVLKGLTTTKFSGRSDHAAVAFDNKLWVIGGFHDITPIKYVTKNDVWYSP